MLNQKRLLLPLLLALALLLSACGGSVVPSDPVEASESAPTGEQVSEPASDPEPTAAFRAVAAGRAHTLALREDGTVCAAGDETAWRGVSAWRDITAICAGDAHSVGLRTDGTVVALGDNSYGQCNTAHWTEVTAICAGAQYTLGLRADGTLLCAGELPWPEALAGTPAPIRSLSGNSYRLAMLCEDGSVLVYGNLSSADLLRLQGWTDMTALCVSANFVAGLRADGTVALLGNNYEGDVSVIGWYDIVSLAAGNFHLLGLRADGTVVSTGGNAQGQCETAWENISSVAAGADFSVALTDSGEVLFAGSNAAGQCDADALARFREESVMTVAETVSGWSDIVSLRVSGTPEGKAVVLALKKDGTVVSCGNDGLDLSGWTDVTDIAASEQTFLGLRSDGTVLAAGNNEYEQCEVSSWKEAVSLAAGNEASFGIDRSGALLFAGFAKYSPALMIEAGYAPNETWSPLSSVVFSGETVCALRTDGTVLAAGWDEFPALAGEANAACAGRGIVSVAAGYEKLGVVCADGSAAVFPDAEEVGAWQGVQKLALGDGHTVALLSDGTAVACGRNDCGQCDVTGWSELADVACTRFGTFGLTRDGRVLFTGLA